MARANPLIEEEERKPLTEDTPSARSSIDERRPSVSTASTTSLVLETLNNGHAHRSANAEKRYRDADGEWHNEDGMYDVEDTVYKGEGAPVDRKTRRLLWAIGVLCFAGWCLALVGFITSGRYKHPSTQPHDPSATSTRKSGKQITLEQIQMGYWRAQHQSISWIAGAQGEDGLMLEQQVPGKPYLVVEDVKNVGRKDASDSSITLMEKGGFQGGSRWVMPSDVWPSADLKKVLVQSDREKGWRHSSSGLYWIFDVENQKAEPLDPDRPNEKIQLASWSPTSDSVVFTRNNNMYLRRLSEQRVETITADGGSELFYGVPDWVYEEEVFAGASATWWSPGGDFVAFLRTDESPVPTYPVQYFLSRPSGEDPKPGLENYPEVRNIKYPKAGAPNPVVSMLFYDLNKKEVFSVKIDDDFEDLDRLITEVVWAGKTKKVLIRETNRESDTLKVVLIDVDSRTGKTVRSLDISGIDGGWFEVSEDTTYVPADENNGRPHDGYIDTVVYEGYDHLAYFETLDAQEPTMLTKGFWEVVEAPSAVDLKNNLVYFMATKDGSIQRHAYSVKLDGTDLKPVTDTSKDGFFDVSFSKGAGYALLSYDGPGIPWQKVISTPSNSESYEKIIEENKHLDQLARTHELPILNYLTVNVDGFELNVLERLPPHFDKNKKYPVIFQLYNGPGSQQVSKSFGVDFQSYMASGLGYIVITVDGRGTGFKGRKHRVVVRGNLGHWEAHDQIAVAKTWAKRKYVDEDRIAIWGWSYGGFMTLKTLEMDGGETFKYGMAVAPVTDWKLYGKSKVLETKIATLTS
jgi:dipeptidyl aminopeptidase B